MNFINWYTKFYSVLFHWVRCAHWENNLGKIIIILSVSTIGVWEDTNMDHVDNTSVLNCSLYTLSKILDSGNFSSTGKAQFRSGEQRVLDQPLRLSWDILSGNWNKNSWQLLRSPDIPELYMPFNVT